MQERKQDMVKRKNPFIRIAVLTIPLVVLLLLSQTVFAETTYVINDGSRVLVHTSSATDPAAVLNEAGLALGADDTYTTQTGIGISEITVQRSHTVTIDNGGEVMAVSTTDETVGELLSRLGISVDGQAVVSVPLEMDTHSGLVITVSRTLQETQTYTAAIAHDVTYYNDYSLPAGITETVREGQDGQLLCTANVVYVDGVETNRTVVEQTVIQQPVEEVIAVGVGCAPLPPKDPGSELVITDSHIYLPNGEVLTYTGTTRMLGSAYSQYDKGCGTITYSGTTVHIGTVAVDPRWIPLGTRMFIVSADGDYVYGIATAEDTGSSIIDARVDLYFPTPEECNQFGMRDVIIYFLG